MKNACKSILLFLIMLMLTPIFMLMGAALVWISFFEGLDEEE